MFALALESGGAGAERRVRDRGEVSARTAGPPAE